MMELIDGKAERMSFYISAGRRRHRFALFENPFFR
jgi:hypothetical protein